jgi:hypothetical protein
MIKKILGFVASLVALFAGAKWFQARRDAKAA